jgi:hypothetical protein
MYFLFSLWPFFALGQVSTGFENGLGGEWDQFPQNRWESSPDQPLSGSYSLHHSFDNTVSGLDRISIKTGIFDASHSISWEFKLRYGYTCSSTNNWQVYLASDKRASEVGNSDFLNAYILGVNITGSDDSLRLYAIRKGKLTRLGTTSLNFEKDIGSSVFHCMIRRDSLAGWEIYGSKEDSALRRIGTFMESDVDMPELKHFMLSYSYTSSKDRLLWFDDLSIRAGFLRDTVPPGIAAFSIPNANQIILELTEGVDTSGFNLEQIILLPGNIYPERVQFKEKGILCFFNPGFIQKTNYKLIVNDLLDIDTNILPCDTLEFVYYRAEKYDIVFTEVMADPSPAVYLPDREYIEIYNRSNFPIDLDSFRLSSAKKEWIFPPYIINPGEYIEVTSGNETGKNKLALFPSASVITNDGQQFFLKSKSNELISALEFYSQWYGDEFKSQGGWSLEKIDVNNLCGGKDNWKASEDPSGGTPGRQNSVKSVNIDVTAPYLERLEFISDNRIRLIYSESIDPVSIPSMDSFVLFPGLNIPDSLIFPDFFCDRTEIVFKEKFLSGVSYGLSIPEGIQDCAGNLYENGDSIRFGIPSLPALTDLILTEVLFSALPGCAEFIEIYNLSENLLDLSDIRISVAATGESGMPVIPINEPVLIFPGDFMVLCKDKQSLLSCFDVNNPANVIEVSDLPALPDGGACVRLYNRSLETLDVFCYVPEDEFPMLSDIHGVSLERLILERKTGDQSAWHSASSVAGFGTPGSVNSQSLSGEIPENKVELIPEVFSPDNDGKDDILEIHYSFDKEGFVGTIAVFDPSGRTICFLGENEILGTSGMFLWDGRDDTGGICRTGLYLVYFEIWNLRGAKERFKKAVVLVRQ